MNKKSDGNTNGRRCIRVQIESFKENELITGISILAVLKYSGSLEVTKCLLVEPILSYSVVTQKLKTENTHIESIEELILKEQIAFSDFNDRYYEYLVLSINAMMLFRHMKLITIENGIVTYINGAFNLEDSSLGNKAATRVKAAKKLATILTKGAASDLYLSLRIEL